MLVTFTIAALTVLTLLAAGFALAGLRRRRPRPKAGTACIQGGCGDTMEIGLHVSGGRVDRVRRRTSGCANSCMCVEAAARQAVGKTPRELLTVDADSVARCAGGVPDDHRHCARLATATLHAAAADYLDSEPSTGRSREKG